MSKKIILLFVLSFCALYPVTLNALEDTVYVTSQGSTGGGLKSDYHWSKNTNSEYMSYSECKAKNGSFDYNDSKTSFEVTCSNDNPNLICDNNKYLSDTAKCSDLSKTVKCVYFKTNKETMVPAKDLNSSRQRVLYKCSWSEKSSGVSTKNLKQYSYSAGDAKEAYCIHPGKAFTAQTYYLREDWDVSECESSLDSYYCGLAATMLMVKQEGVSSEVATTALRLWAAYAGSDAGDGWWDPEENSNYSVNVYENTVDYILSNNYMGSNTSPKLGVIYGNTSLLNSAISIFNSVRSGSVDFWTPNLKANKKQYVVDAKGEVKDIIIHSNFTSDTKIISVKANNNVSLDYSISGSDIIIKAKVPVPINIASFAITIKYDHPGDISNIKLYDASRGANKYQPMIVLGTIDETEEIIETGDDSSIGMTNVEIIIDDTEDPTDSTDPNCCSDLKVKNSVPLECDESTEGIIEDPEMCAILNSCDNAKKAKYNYSNEYGNKYCSVFCREELKFTFMDKTEVIAGRQFKYNVQSKLTSKYLLSTVIYGTRECTSNDIKYEQWEKDYLNTNKEVLNNFNNWKLWEARYNHETEKAEHESTSGCAGCDDCCGSYSCEPCSTITNSDGSTSVTCSTCFIDGSEGYSKEISWNWYLWSNATYYNTVASYNSNGFVTSVYGNISNADGQSGSSSGSCGCTPCNGSSCWGNAGTSAYSSMIKYKNAYETSLKQRDELLTNIQNCNLLDYNNFTYIPEHKKIASTSTTYYKMVSDYKIQPKLSIDYNDEFSGGVSIKSDVVQGPTTVSWCKDCDYSTYCAGCNTELSLGNLSTKKIDRWVCSGTESSSRCANEQINIPDNKTADLKTNKEAQFYQSAQFYTQVYTGNVSTTPNSVGHWIALETFAYPIELTKENGYYEVNVKYSKLGDINRKVGAIKDGEYSCGFEVTNETIMYECDTAYCECEGDSCNKNPDGSIKTGTGILYRSIDLSNLFPTNRVKGYNWANGENYIKAIEDLGNDMWSTVEPHYTVVLTPANIKAIQRYNSSTVYTDYSLNCNGLDCTSDFLDMIRDNVTYADSVDLFEGRRATVDLKKNWYNYVSGGGN